MIHGPPERGSEENTVGSSFPVEKIMRWGGEVTHCAPARGWEAKGSVLLASLPPRTPTSAEASHAWGGLVIHEN